MGKRVGVIGLGSMGGPMARNLIKRGHDVVGFDIDRRRIETLTAAGGKGAASIPELVRQVDYTLLSLPNLHALEDVVLGQEGVLAAARPGLTILDACTSQPDLAERLAAEAANRGVRYVDAPVSGTTPAAEAATLVIMAGGDAETVADCRDIFESIGSKIVHCGPTGKGQAMKLVINTVLLVTQLAGYEGMALGVKVGLDPDQILDVINSGAAQSYIVGFKLEKVLRRDFSMAGSVGICNKDLDLTNAMARNAGVPLALPAIAQQVYMAGKLAGLTDLDSAAMIQVYERMLGIEVRGKAATT